LKQPNPKGRATQICFKVKGTSCPERVCKKYQNAKAKEEPKTNISTSKKDLNLKQCIKIQKHRKLIQNQEQHQRS
jgi:hypothetical protein